MSRLDDDARNEHLPGFTVVVFIVPRYWVSLNFPGLSFFSGRGDFFLTQGGRLVP